MVTNGVGNYILGDLLADDLLVILVDLNHFLDTSKDVVGEQILDGRGSHFSPQKILGR